MHSTTRRSEWESQARSRKWKQNRRLNNIEQKLNHNHTSSTNGIFISMQETIYHFLWWFIISFTSLLLRRTHSTSTDSQPTTRTDVVKLFTTNKSNSSRNAPLCTRARRRVVVANSIKVFSLATNRRDTKSARRDVRTVKRSWNFKYNLW